MLPTGIFLYEFKHWGTTEQDLYVGTSYFGFENI
jgi:hypothetical protein